MFLINCLFHVRLTHVHLSKICDKRKNLHAEEKFFFFLQEKGKPSSASFKIDLKCKKYYYRVSIC